MYRFNNLLVCFDLTVPAVFLLVSDEIQHCLDFPCRHLRILGQLLIENAIPTFSNIEWTNSDQHLLILPDCNSGKLTGQIFNQSIPSGIPL